MSKTLTLDEMLDVIEEHHADDFPHFKQRIETLAQEAADFLANEYTLDVGHVAREPAAFAGTCASFFLTTKDQTPPPWTADYDPGEPITFEEA